MELKGKVALITGAAGGIGRALALSFAGEGADIAVADTDLIRGEEVRREIEGMGRRALVVPCDVSQDESVIETAAMSIFAFGRIDILVCGAGIGMRGPLESHAIEDWRRLLNVNLLGTVRCVDALLPHFYKNGGGYILNVAPHPGFPPPDGIADNCLPYMTSKLGVAGFTEGLRGYLKPRGIAVSLLCPGPAPGGEPDFAVPRPDLAARLAVEAMKTEKFLIPAETGYEMSCRSGAWQTMI